LSSAKVSFVIGVMVAFSLLLSSLIVSVHASDPSLPEILTHFGFNNVAESAVETFPSGTYNITLYAEFAQYYDENELSFHQVDTSNFNVIFSGPEGGSGYLTPITKTFSADYQFGLSLSRTTTLPFRYFTELSRNPNATKWAKVYENLDDPSMILVGFDERTFCSGTGDEDHNDMVFSLQLQHYLNVVSPYDAPSGEGWYYNGADAYASLVIGIVDHSNGTRRAFTQWSGDASGTSYSRSNPIIMDQNKTAIADWKTQHYLTIKTSPLDVATIPGEGWYDQGENVVLTAPPTASYGFDYWDVDGAPQGSEVNPITVAMNTPHTATAHYAKTFTLTIESTAGGSTTPTPGTYNFNENSTVQVTATPDTGYALDHWELDGINVGSANPYSVLMNKNHNLKSVFTLSALPLTVLINPMETTIYQFKSVTFTSAVSGGTAPYSYHWYLDADPVSGATSDKWLFKPTTAGVYYVYLKVTDAIGNTKQSETAKVTVVTTPVGGQSYRIQPQTKVDIIIPYIVTITALTSLMTLVNRKRR
jgi:hypothetical protein